MRTGKFPVQEECEKVTSNTADPTKLHIFYCIGIIRSFEYEVKTIPCNEIFPIQLNLFIMDLLYNGPFIIRNFLSQFQVKYCNMTNLIMMNFRHDELSSPSTDVHHNET